MTTPPSRTPSMGEIVTRELLKAHGRYTVGPSNVERVVGLTCDDVLAALRPTIEAEVRKALGLFHQPSPDSGALEKP